MANKNYKKWLVWGSVIIIVIMISSVVFAEDNSNGRGDISVGSCFEEGTVDFVAFLNALIWTDGVEGVKEDWNDVLYRNQCHAMDVLGLLNQKDNIRKKIRSAFMTCHNEKIPNLVNAYKKTLAEIYYVRRVFDFESKTFMNRDKLYDLMKVKFVDSGFYSDDGDFKEEDFKTFFVDVEAKYDERKNSYKICTKGSWEAVAERWEELEKKFVSDIEKSTQGVENRANNLKEVATEGWSDRLETLGNVSTNGLDPDEFGEEFLAEWEEYGEFYTKDYWTKGLKTKDITTEDYYSVTQNSSYIHDLATMRTSMDNKYKILYLETSDTAISNFTSKIQELNNEIVETIKIIKNIENCSDNINSNQCP